MSKRKRKNHLIAAGSVIGIILTSLLLTNLVFPDGETRAVETEPATERYEVTVSAFEPENIRSEIRVTGRIKSTQRIELFSEVQGVLKGGDHPFRTGVRFNRGDLLIMLESTESALELSAQRSRFFTTLAGVLSDMKQDYPEHYNAWSDLADRFQPDSRLPELPLVDDGQLRLFLTSRGIYEQYFSIRSAENRLDKFTLHAPFNGELRGADLTPGNLVKPGVRLGEFVGDTYELETFVSLQDLQFITEGDHVELTSSAAGITTDGTITRIGSSVDPETQAFPVYVEIRDPSLRSGLYLEGSISGKLFEMVAEIPRNLLTRSNTVLVVENDKVTHKKVEPLLFNPQSVIVRGLNADDKVIDLRAGASSLVGSKVTIIENNR